MQKKQELLMNVINILDKVGRSNKLTLIKIMFLIHKQNKINYSSYNFYPYKYGPFSTRIYSDLYYFYKQGLLSKVSEEDDKNIQVTPLGKTFCKIEYSLEQYIKSILKQNPTINSLIDYVYDKYPEFTIKSVRKNNPHVVNQDTTPGFFLIGYEGRDIDAFLNVLIQNNIDILIDVRNNPRSMKYDFNKERLKKYLNNVKIEYESIPELGIRSELRKDLRDQADYESLFRDYALSLPSKKEFTKRLIKMVENERIALMCFEKDVNQCHRRELGKYFQNKGIKVSII